jgi:glycosyltransferase involved in cell wall biosynthesis
VKICLVSHEYPPESARGGIGTQTWNKAQGLHALGHEVTVVSSTGGPPPPPMFDGGATVHRVAAPGNDLPVYETHTYWLGYAWKVLEYLRGPLGGEHFDLIQFPEYGAEGFAFQMDRPEWDRVPVIVQLHGPLSMFADRMGWPEPGTAFHKVGIFMERSSVVEADALLASSANIADFCAERYEVDREGIDVIHCGIDEQLFRPSPEGAGPSSPTVLFVGNIAKNKGIGTVFDAVMALRSTIPEIKLQVLGKADDDLLHDLSRTAESRGAPDAFEYLGFQGDRRLLPDIYRGASVFCSPAQHEPGVANVYVEAMACGVPVVAARTGGTPEAITDGVNGCLVDPGDVDATADALGRILTDDDMRTEMGRRGRQKVEEYFSLPRYTERVVTAYEKLVGNRPTASSRRP